MVVAGWLKLNAQPLGMALGRSVISVETFTDDYGNPAYYVVYPEAGGFVVVSADDLVEPIIAFCDEGVFEPSTENPLGALVSRDIKGRIASIGNSISLQMEGAALSRGKWGYFINAAESSENGNSLMGVNSVSDVRAEPFVKSKWGQTTTCDEVSFNYYTPSNYPCGCTATAMAQLMRYHEYPNGRASVGRRRFEIKVDDISQYVYTRGGDGSGGPYDWSLMVLEPDCDTTQEQREAIGALCHDASVAVKTEFKENASASSLRDARTALLGTFLYSSAVYGRRDDGVISSEALNEMINSNLDAGYPVILGINKDDTGLGHAAVVDGYGYDFSTLYHHINMGWNGGDDIWYNLPEVDYSDSGYYNVITGCIYNIYTYGSGEIISGRVTDLSREPVSGATVIARGWGGPYTAETNERGIYALVKVGGYSTYTVSVIKPGYDFPVQEVTTGRSGDTRDVSGNKWGVDFIGSAAAAGFTSDYSREDFESADFSKFPWENSSDSSWVITFLERYGGTYGAVTGEIHHDESTSLRVSVECTSGDITFYYKVSSEPACDYLRFYIDGVEKAKWSGMEDWDAATFSVPAGTRTFEWRYTKDSSISRGSDTAWIDEIEFPIDYGKLCDFDGSGMVDFIDFGFLAGQWLGRGTTNSADLNGDRGVDFEDLEIFAENWLAD
jgi:hypothetical protein